MKKFWIAAGILVFCAGLGWGTDYQSLSTGDWNNTATWEDITALGTPAGPPVAGDTATILATHTVTLQSGGASVASLTILGTLNFNGETITVSGDFDASGGTIDISTGTPILELTGTGDIRLPSGGSLYTLEITGGTRTAQTPISASSVTISGGGTLDLVGNDCDASTSFANDGTISLVDTVQFTSVKPVPGSGSKIILTNPSPSADVTNFYDLELQGGSYTLSGGISNSLDVSDGTLTLSSPLNLGGTLTQSGGTIAAATNSITVTGVVNQTGGVLAGTNLTVTASDIALNGNNTASPVSLTSDGGITYKGAVTTGLTVTKASITSGTGAIAITNDNGNLTIQNSGTGISGNGNVSLSTTTSGNIAINNAVSGSTINVTAAGGITGAGNITGGSLTASAGAAISITGPNHTPSSVDLSTTRGGITYNGAITTGLTVTAGGTGAIEITNTGGSLTVGSVGIISSSGNVILKTITSGGITINNAVTGNSVEVTALGGIIGSGNITGTSLTANAGTDINLTGTNTPSSVSLTGGGYITYNGAATTGLTVTKASITSGTGAIAITNDDGDLTIQNSGTGISGNGSVSLSTTTSGNIVIDKDVRGGNTATINVTAAGTISGAGDITGGILVASAGTGINLFGTNNTPDSVDLSTTSGGITYNGAVTTNLTVTTASITSGTGAIAITNTVGDLVASGGITAGTGGDVVLSAPAASKNITVSNSITNARRLTLIAGPSYNSATPSPSTTNGGTVTFGTGVTVSGVADESIIISAGSVSITGTVTASTGNIYLYLDDNTLPGFTSTSFVLLSSIGELVISSRTVGRDIVYYTTSSTGGNIPSSGLLLIPSGSVTGTIHLKTRGSGNIYLADVSDSDNSKILKVDSSAGSGYIEFYKKYFYNGSNSGHLNLSPNTTRGVQTFFSSTTEIDIGPATFAVGSFAFNIIQGHASITAAGITLGGAVDGFSSGDNNLLLDVSAGTNNTISITGPVGYTTRLGDIEVRSMSPATDAVTFTGAVVNAKSYKQTGAGGTGGNGSTRFNGTQDYTEGFSFTGTNLVVNNPLQTDSGNTNNGPFSFNGVDFTLNGSLTTSTGNANIVTIANTGAFTTTAAGAITAGGKFEQTGAGAVSLAGNISTTNSTAANASISFLSAVEIAGTAVTLNSQTGSGNITFPTGITGDVDRTNPLTLNAGSGQVSVTGSVGTSITNLGNLVITAGTATFNPSGSIFSNAFTFTGGALTLHIPLTTVENIAISTSGTFTQNSGAVITSGGKFEKTDPGASTIGANIETIGSPSANAIISFASIVNLTADVIFKAPSTGGKVELRAGNSGNFTLTLEGGNSTVSPPVPLEISQDSGTITDIIIVSASYIKVSSGTIVQDPAGTGKTLTLTNNAALDTTAGSWFVGPPSLTPPWYMVSNPSGSSTDPYYTNPAPAFTTGFAGFNGKLIMGNKAKLNTKDFYTQMTDSGNHEFILTIPSAVSETCDIEASGSVTINETFENPANGIHSTLTMTGSGSGSTLQVPTNPTGVPDVDPGKPDIYLPLVDLGNFVAAGGDAGSVPGPVVSPGPIINSNVRFLGTVTINSGKVLSTHTSGTKTNPSPHIFVYPHPGGTTKTWEDLGGKFEYNYSIVEFGNRSDLTGGNSYEIIGDTEWWILACHENKATIKFENWKPGSTGHRIYGTLKVKPVSPATGFINLTRLTPVPYNNNITPNFPGHPIRRPPDNPNHFFWYFVLAPEARLDINYVKIMYSFSETKIPVPAEANDPEWYVSAWPYVYVDGNNSADPGDGRNHWDVNWFVFDNFFYGYTEDSNHNGRIDRIRLQSAFYVIGENEGGFSDFEVSVVNNRTGGRYKVTGYRRVETTPTLNSTDMDSIYVELEELPYSDSGDTLHWRIERNTSLWDYVTYDGKTGSALIGKDRSNAGGPDEGDTVDTAPPRINYALVLPGGDKLFIQFSEAVEFDFTTVEIAGLTLTQKEEVSPSEFVYTLPSPYSVAQLAAGSLEFTVNGLKDKAALAVDLHAESADRPYHFMFPSPKYPKSYLYDKGGFPAYVTSPDPPDPPGPPPPPWPGRVYPPNSSYDDTTGAIITAVNHRVTDALISVPPTNAADTRYFVWPIFARYSESSNNAALGSNDFWGQKPEDTGIIWQFNGKKYLEERDITLQFRLNPSFSASPSLRYAFQVPEHLRAGSLHGNPGLWLPYPSPPYIGGPPKFVNLTPDFLNSGKPQTSHPLYTESSFPGRFDSSGAPLFTYKFSKDDPEYKSPAMLDFFFHLNGTPADLFVARLDINPGVSIPSNWYRLVRPFSFEIHDITRQRSGVTILNNVINPNTGESTYVHYQLVKGGQVTIQVFTMDGTMVDILYRGRRDAGEYRAVWGGKNRGGRAVARGMYFIRVVGPDIDEIRKVMVVK